MAHLNTTTDSSGLATNSKDTAEDELPVAWSAQQVHEWRKTQRPMPLGWLVAAQFGFGFVWAAAAYAGFGSVAAMSAGYGAMCAAVPSAILARGMRSALSSANPVGGFMLWELVKMALGAAMLVAAPKLLGVVNWVALLTGLILTLKVVFLAALWPNRIKAKPEGVTNIT